jgi:hypothetical protein
VEKGTPSKAKDFIFFLFFHKSLESRQHKTTGKKRKVFTLHLFLTWGETRGRYNDGWRLFRRVVKQSARTFIPALTK